MREIDPFEIKTAADLNNCTNEEISYLSNHLDYLELDDDDQPLTEQQVKQLAKVRKLLASKFGGKHANRKAFVELEKQLDKLFWVEYTDQDVIDVIKNALALSERGVSLRGIEFQCIPAPEGYQATVLAINHHPAQIDHDFDFQDFKSCFDRDLSDDEKQEAIKRSTEIIERYHNGIEKFGSYSRY